MDRENLYKIYAEVSNYDRHYSTVRAGTWTFLISVAAAIGAVLIREKLFFTAAFIPFLILAVAILLNLYFQRLTHCCRLIQRDIENEVEQSFLQDYKPNYDLLKFRHNLAIKYPESKLRFDPPIWILFVFSLLLLGYLVIHSYL